jgi:hypothetical protein
MIKRKAVRNNKGQWAKGNLTKWKGGKSITKDGYIMIYSPKHPFCIKNGYVLEHRLKMEKKLGRFLKKDENIHHLDGNVKNNKLNNLYLSSNSEHIRKYHSSRKRDKLGRFI